MQCIDAVYCHECHTFCGLSVSVGLMSPAKMDKPIKMPFAADLCGTKKLII